MNIHNGKQFIEFTLHGDVIAVNDNGYDEIYWLNQASLFMTSARLFTAAGLYHYAIEALDFAFDILSDLGYVK